MSANPTFSKPALAIIAVLLIVTSISLYFAISQNCCSAAHEKNKADSSAVATEANTFAAKSSTPTWDTDTIRNSLADSCVQAYLDSNTCIKTDSANTDVQLKGFAVNVSDIGPLLRDPNIVRLYLEFAVSPQYLHESQAKQYVTLIVSGLNSSDEMIVNSASHTYYRYEFIRPCPQNCPTK